MIDLPTPINPKNIRTGRRLVLFPSKNQTETTKLLSDSSEIIGIVPSYFSNCSMPRSIRWFTPFLASLLTIRKQGTFGLQAGVQCIHMTGTGTTDSMLGETDLGLAKANDFVEMNL